MQLFLVLLFFFHGHLPQTNGKKKSKGNLALMVGQALQPGSAGEEISVKTTELRIGIVLSLPEGSCNENTNGHQLHSSLYVTALLKPGHIFLLLFVIGKICNFFFMYSFTFLFMTDILILLRNMFWQTAHSCVPITTETVRYNLF